MSFSVCPDKASACLLLAFFCHTEWVFGAPFVYRKKSSTPHVLTHRHKLSVFHGKTDSVISHLISLFSLTTLLLPCTPSLPFHQDCLPGASGVHLCFTAWLQGQKHPPNIQTITHLLGFNPSSSSLIGEPKNSHSEIMSIWYADEYKYQF